MWAFINVATQADPQDIEDVFEAMKKYIAKDDPEETSISINVHAAEQKKRHRENFHLPFDPVATVYTAGPDATGIGRKQSFYLRRNEKGKLVRELLSAHKFPSDGVLPKRKKKK